jgi:hypothetical protein
VASHDLDRIGELAGFWIGDHAHSHGRAWPVFSALGIAAGIVDQQRTLLEHHDQWQSFGILLVAALLSMAWAERTQATW